MTPPIAAPAGAPTPGTLTVDGARVTGLRKNGDGTRTIVHERTANWIDIPVGAGDRLHFVPDGTAQLVEGSHNVQPHLTPGAMQADGSRQVGTRRNADGSLTKVLPPVPAGERARAQLGPHDRWHELPDGRIQLIQGSLLGRGGAGAPGGPAPAPANPAVPANPAAPAVDGIRPVGPTRADGYRLSTFPSRGSGSGQADAAGRLYVSAPGGIDVFGPDFKLLQRIALPVDTTDVAPSPDGSILYITQKQPDGTLLPRRMNRAGDGSYAIDQVWKLQAFPYGGKEHVAEGLRLATDRKGNLFVADGSFTRNLQSTVIKYDADGTYVTRFGEYAEGNREDEISWAEGRFYWGLAGIIVSEDGDTVYTTEVGNNRVQRWDSKADGTYGVTTSWGATRETDPQRTGSDAPGRFAAPYDVGLDAEGNVYVMNTTVSQIQKFDPHGRFITSMFVGDRGADERGTRPGHGMLVTARGDAISIETGHMMERAG